MSYSLLDNDCEHFSIKLAEALCPNSGDRFNRSQSVRTKADMRLPDKTERHVRRMIAPMTFVAKGAAEGLVKLAVLLLAMAGIFGAQMYYDVKRLRETPSWRIE